MRWTKRGLIYCPSGRFGWDQSHASLPTIDDRDETNWHVYYAARDAHGRSRIGRLSIDPQNDMKVIDLEPMPILELGRRGTFDDNGMMPTCVVNHGRLKYLYYIGWNPQVTVSYRLAIGLAISDDGGRRFFRHSEGPIIDRDAGEPFFCSAPWVLRDGERWRMWYQSCTGWEEVAGKPEPRYHLKYAESSDGIHWTKTGIVCIDYDDFTKAVTRPCVLHENGAYRMWYSFRGLGDYRSDPTTSYRLGYAESGDGLIWRRQDQFAGLERSESGWDSEMLAYACLVRFASVAAAFYNGNGFGQSGFGWATAEYASGSRTQSRRDEGT